MRRTCHLAMSAGLLAFASLAHAVTFTYTYDPSSNRLLSIESTQGPHTVLDYTNNGSIRLDIPAASDTDADGLSAFQELREHATDPLSNDSDMDGVFDGEEIQLGINPNASDSDSDGLDDGAELAINADPNNSDSDGDGMLDGSEVDIGRNPILNEPMAIQPSLNWYLQSPEPETSSESSVQ